LITVNKNIQVAMLLIPIFIQLHPKKYCKCKDNTRSNINKPNRFIVELEIIIHFPTRPKYCK